MNSRESHNAMLPGWIFVTRRRAEPFPAGNRFTTSGEVSLSAAETPSPMILMLHQKKLKQ